MCSLLCYLSRFCLLEVLACSGQVAPYLTMVIDASACCLATRRVFHGGGSNLNTDSLLSFENSVVVGIEPNILTEQVLYH